MPKPLERLPIFACAGLLGFFFLTNLWNFSVEDNWPKLRLRSSQPLNGAPHFDDAVWSFKAFFAGETQHAVSLNVGRKSWAFPMSVRVKN